MGEKSGRWERGRAGEKSIDMTECDFDRVYFGGRGEGCCIVGRWGCGSVALKFGWVQELGWDPAFEWHLIIVDVHSRIDDYVRMALPGECIKSVDAQHTSEE
jgi:hypothetical protein